MSPTQRALKDAKALGFMAQVVERWNQWSKTRHDLFDCIDIIACRKDTGVIGIQVTSDSNHAARMEKARKSERIGVWLAAGGRIEGGCEARPVASLERRREQERGVFLQRRGDDLAPSQTDESGFGVRTWK